MRQIPRTAAVVAAAFAAALTLTGCAAAGGYDRGGAASDRAPMVAEGELGSAADGGEAPAPADQALVITGSITITADDPIAASAKATSIALAAGGRVDARNEYAPRDGDAGRATLTLRIPADRVEDVRTKLGELGSVDETTFDAVDVGTQQRDLEVRITTLRASIARYTEWLATAEKTSDLIELESAISERQTELERLEAQRRELADQVAMSTITLELRSEALAPPPEGPKNFWDGLVVGWTAFVGFWAGVLVAVGVGLPWLVALALVAVVVIVLVRRSNRAARVVAPASPSDELSGPGA